MFCCHKHHQHFAHTLCVCVDTLFPLEKAIPIMFECIIIHYQSLQTWIGHNATHYYILNALPLALLHALSYIVSQFTMV